MAFKRGMTVDVGIAYVFMPSRADDLDLDARSQWHGRGKKSA